MKTLLAAAALVLMATAANAEALPKRFYGEWCSNADMTDKSQHVVDRCPAGDIAINARGFNTEESNCKVVSSRPVPSGKFYAVTAKVKCTSDHGNTNTTVQIGLYETDVLFFMWQGKQAP